MVEEKIMPGNEYFYRPVSRDHALKLDPDWQAIVEAQDRLIESLRNRLEWWFIGAVVMGILAIIGWAR